MKAASCVAAAAIALSACQAEPEPAVYQEEVAAAAADGAGVDYSPLEKSNVILLANDVLVDVSPLLGGFANDGEDYSCGTPSMHLFTPVMSVNIGRVSGIRFLIRGIPDGEFTTRWEAGFPRTIAPTQAMIDRLNESEKDRWIRLNLVTQSVRIGDRVLTENPPGQTIIGAVWQLLYDRQSGILTLTNDGRATRLRRCPDQANATRYGRDRIAPARP